MDKPTKKFPEGMVPLGDTEFPFECHAGVSCFTFCCTNVDMTLYPYDIIRLKNSLGIDSEDFIRTYTFLQNELNPFFPSVKLKLLDDNKKSCPFLKEEGCSVYTDRPSACRTYPLEIAVDREQGMLSRDEFYFLTHHEYCLGHFEKKKNSIKSWSRHQRLHEFNLMNNLWAEVDTVFSTNPWRGEGAGGEKQQLAFMVCYNIDGFRRFVEKHKLVKLFKLDKSFRKRIVHEDSELLKFGFEWLKLILLGKSSLVKK